MKDKTFGVRLLSFLQDFYIDVSQWSQMDQEEYEYLCISAIEEIERKFNDINNQSYFQNIVKGCMTYTEFIEKRFAEQFVKFLHKIKKF